MKPDPKKIQRVHAAVVAVAGVVADSVAVAVAVVVDLAAAAVAVVVEADTNTILMVTSIQGGVMSSH
jgi:hypothetical protein